MRSCTCSLISSSLSLAIASVLLFGSAEADALDFRRFKFVVTESIKEMIYNIQCEGIYSKDQRANCYIYVSCFTRTTSAETSTSNTMDRVRFEPTTSNSMSECFIH